MPDYIIETSIKIVHLYRVPANSLGEAWSIAVDGEFPEGYESFDDRDYGLEIESVIQDSTLPLQQGE